MLGRGGNVDTSGAWGGFTLKSAWGTEHRIVMYMDGFRENGRMVIPRRGDNLHT